MSQRTEQTESLIVKEVSHIIARDIEPPDGCLITVMGARVSPDLKHVKILVSILPENRTASALDTLRRSKGEIQRKLNSRLTMKFSPRINWELDMTTRKYAAIDDALKS